MRISLAYSSKLCSAPPSASPSSLFILPKIPALVLQELPFDQQGLVFSVVGGIGVGKSTLLKNFANSQTAQISSFHPIPEPVSQWRPFLELFYSDPEKFALTMQWCVLTTLASAITWFSNIGIDQLRERCANCIAVFSIIHGEAGNIPPDQLQRILDSLDKGGFKKSDVIFLLDVSGEIAFDRALGRGREEEKAGLLLDYCITLRETYLYVLENLDGIVILLDASQSQEDLLSDFENAFNCASAAFGRPALPSDPSRIHYLTPARLPSVSQSEHGPAAPLIAPSPSGLELTDFGSVL